MTLRLATTPEAIAQAQGVRHRLRAAGSAVELDILADEMDARSALEAVSSGDAELALVQGVNAGAAETLGLETLIVLAREEARDVLVVADGKAVPLRSLPSSARVAVAGARRRAFLRAHRRDLEPVSLDNGTTPLCALESGAADAVILGSAEARRSGLDGMASEMLEAKAWLPAPGQGSYALFGSPPVALRAEIESFDDEPSRRALEAELALVEILGLAPGSALGALAQPTGLWIRLWAGAASPDGSALVRSDLTGPVGEPRAVASAVAKQLAERGLAAVLSGGAG